MRPLDRATAFSTRYGLKSPILLAPMAGASPASLSIAVANAGSMGAMGALLTPPAGIRAWVEEFRANSRGPFQLNVWIPDPPPRREAHVEARMRAFLANWGPAVPAEAANAAMPDFAAQLETFIELKPTAVSSIMGVFPERFVARLKDKGIAWFATATTLAEARAAQAAGADAIIAQGYEAGGHRGAFDQAAAERQGVGLVALVPRLADHLACRSLPPAVSATAAASPRRSRSEPARSPIGTAFLRCPEAHTHPAWAGALADLEPEHTTLTGR